MSDNNLPFDIQMEIIKWLPVKPLIHFRSVSKPWKCVIDSSHFIKCYGARQTHPHSRILCYKLDFVSNPKLIYLKDDDIETFKIQEQEFTPFVVSPLLKQYRVSYVVGGCHGLLCLFAFDLGINNAMAVFWNPSIRKSFGIAIPSYNPLTHYHLNVFGFGVCLVNRDPTLVRILCPDNLPWHVEVFTSSSGVWNVIPSANFPLQSIKLNFSTNHVVIDGFIYWGACEKTFADDGRSIMNHMVVSFNLFTNEFKVVDLPRSVTNGSFLHVSVSKLRGSLVVLRYIMVKGIRCCGVWLMERDSSFRKLFSIGTPFLKILGFSKKDEPILEIHKADRNVTTLNVYDPCSQQIKNLGISGAWSSFFLGSDKESLLLLDHSDSHIYSDDS